MRGICCAAFTAALGVIVQSMPAAAATYEVTVDTSSLAGQTVGLAFDFVGNGPVPPTGTNFITINNGKIDGTAVGPVPNENLGSGISGDLPGKVTLNDQNDLFTSFFPVVPLGNTLSFSLKNTENFGGPVPANLSFGIDDPTTFAPLFTTNDPSGLDYLFRVTIYGPLFDPYSKIDCGSPAPNFAASCVSVFDQAAVVQTTPLPAALPLFASGLGALGFAGWRRRRKAA
jgi:hypothetical protein